MMPIEEIITKMFHPLTPDEVKATIRTRLEEAEYTVQDITLWASGAVVVARKSDAEGWTMTMVPYEKFGFTH